jgi:Tol biopolymer transport system component
MKKLSLIFTLLMLASIVSVFLVPLGYCSWRTPTQLTNNAADNTRPSISNDGTKIAFQSDVDGDQEIFVINSDGTGLTQLTTNTANDRAPSISGNGSKIAFESNVDGDWEIFLINSDGSGLTQLTSNSLTDAYPSISDDGSKIAFYSDVGGGREVFVVNSDGSGLTQVTSNAATVGLALISGDGSKIAYESNVDGDREIFVINSDGTGLTQLTHNTADDYNPSISNDGSKVAFESNVNGDWEIFLVNSDGSGLTQLTSNTVDDRGPSMSGDATEIAFYSNADGDWEIFVINSDGTGLTKLTSTTVTDAFPSTDGYGSKVAYVSGTIGEIFVVTQVDLSPPTGNVIIDGGAAATDSASVTLTLSATDLDSGVTQMRLANEGEPWSDWELYVTSKSWTLTSGEGEKRVWVYFKNGDGLESTPATDTIILDTTPTVEYHYVVYDQTEYIVETVSNSTVSDLTFNQALARIRFNVDGTTGTTGFCDITIPSELMSGAFTIYKDDLLLIENVDYTQTSNGTHYTFSFTYEHSTHTIEIYATTVIPELSSTMLISTLITATLIVAILKRRKNN